MPVHSKPQSPDSSAHSNGRDPAGFSFTLTWGQEISRCGTRKKEKKSPGGIGATGAVEGKRRLGKYVAQADVGNHQGRILRRARRYEPRSTGHVRSLVDQDQAAVL